MTDRTIAQLLGDLGKRLATISPTPMLDAELLLTEVTSIDRSTLHSRDSLSLTAAAKQRLDENVQRRLSGEPIAYLTGHREFWSLDFRVTPATLVPRPETEYLVEIALELLPQKHPFEIADLGTGSGAIAIALAHEREKSHVTATDVSIAALAVARKNAEMLGIANVTFRAGSWFEPLAGERFDLVVANPPYVALDDPDLDMVHTQHEPALALFAGSDGLSALRAIISGATDHLRVGAHLVVEHGHGHAHCVQTLLCRAGFHSIVTHTDGAGLARVSVGQRHRHPSAGR